MKKNRQILLVEDDLYASETLKFALEAKGHKVALHQTSAACRNGNHPSLAS